MHCCGYALTRRDWMGTIALTSLASMFSAACATTRSDLMSTAPSLAAAERLLRENVSIDVHTHAGPNGITNRTVRPSDALATGMRAGRIAILCLSDVPDGALGLLSMALSLEWPAAARWLKAQHPGQAMVARAHSAAANRDT